MSARGDFAELLGRLRREHAIRAGLLDLESPIYRRLEERAAEAWRAHGPRTPRGKPRAIPRTSDGRVAVALVGARIGRDLVEAYQAAERSAGLEALHGAARRAGRLEAELRALAPRVELRLGGPWRTIATRWESTYATQGFGAAAYARGSAEMALDGLRGIEGLELRVERVERDWLAQARLAERLDVEVARRLPWPDLREWVRLCWARGVNPRVYNPWLPHGYEQRAELDYQGRDLRKIRESSPGGDPVVPKGRA